MAGEGCQSFFVVLFLLLNRRIRKGGEYAAGTTQYLKNRKVIDRGGDYVFGLKATKGIFTKKLKDFLQGMMINISTHLIFLQKKITLTVGRHGRLG